MRRTAVSEFPNDNPLLHQGAIWVLETPCGSLQSRWEPEPEPEPAPASASASASVPASASASAPAPAPARASVPESVPECAPASDPGVAVIEAICDASLDLDSDVDDTDPSPPPVAEDAANDHEPAHSTPPPALDPFDHFVDAMVSIAAAEGAHLIAAALPELLHARDVERDALDGPTVESAVARGFLVRSGDRLRPSDQLHDLLRGWQGVLRSGDFSGCGASMLNEWSAELLAALLAAPQRIQALQYELRRRGVAAFGMVRLAA